MADSIALLINGREIRNFVSYEVDADMWQAANAFALELSSTQLSVRTGDACKLKINGQLELVGHIDAVERTTDRGRETLTVRGRDMMGLVVDEYCKSSVSQLKTSIKPVAEALLGQIPGIDLKTVKYEQGVSTSTRDQIAQLIAVGSIGQTIFASLKSAAQQFGLMFFCMPDGTFCFGTPATAPKGKISFAVVLRKDGKGTNVTRADTKEDISKRYKSIKMCYQLPLPSDGDKSASAITAATISITDPDYPSWAPQKTFVLEDSGEAGGMKARAVLLLNAQRHEAVQLDYTVAGHSFKGRNWTINAFCGVDDDKNGYSGNYLITRRTFKLSREEGVVTKLRLSLPGVRI